MSYQVSDFGDAAHRSSTKTGVKLFIVDRGLYRVIASEAKQSIHPLCREVDCFASLAMTGIDRHAFFSTETKNPSVPVRRGVISHPSGDFSAAFSKSSALSHSTLAVSFSG